MPAGCGLVCEGSELVYPERLSNDVPDVKLVFDMAETLIVAVGNGDDIRAILRSCARLQVESFPTKMSLNLPALSAADF